MGFLRAALAIAAKDLRIEVRARDVLLTMALFAALVLLLCAFALIREGQAPVHATAGVLWIVVALTGTVGLGRAFDREREGSTISALLLAPIDRSAIYVGKLIAVITLMVITEIAAVPLLQLLFDVPILAKPWPLALLLSLGTIGFAAVGSLFAAMLLPSRGRHVLLSILLYPIIVPVLMAGARGTQALLDMPPDLDTVWLWAKILALFDITFITLSLWIFDPLVGPN